MREARRCRAGDDRGCGERLPARKLPHRAGAL